jgi:hypothetical protein
MKVRRYCWWLVVGSLFMGPLFSMQEKLPRSKLTPKSQPTRKQEKLLDMRLNRKSCEMLVSYSNSDNLLNIYQFEPRLEPSPNTVKRDKFSRENSGHHSLKVKQVMICSCERDLESSSKPLLAVLDRLEAIIQKIKNTPSMRQTLSDQADNMVSTIGKIIQDDRALVSLIDLHIQDETLITYVLKKLGHSPWTMPVIKYFVDAGAEINSCNKAKKTPWVIATTYNNLAFIQQLKDLGATGELESNHTSPDNLNFKNLSIHEDLEDE